MEVLTLTIALTISAILAVVLAIRYRSWLAGNRGLLLVTAAAVFFVLAFLVLFYTFPLKRIALGELAVFAAWGPLMIAGTAVVLTGAADMTTIAAGAVYGLGPTLVICAKHRDKLEDDRARGVHTLPALLGDRATGSLLIALALLQVAGIVWLAVHSGLYGLLLPLVVRSSGNRQTKRRCPACNSSRY